MEAMKKFNKKHPDKVKDDNNKSWDEPENFIRI
ncbi:MAG: hypothetical protein A4E26_01435 [Methanobacterium sp. PtaU1.Bin097]|nr:MAG: hypothetical protein A4E26_01435 [Methanobacterium sp. PtaU1.Bin097]